MFSMKMIDTTVLIEFFSGEDESIEKIEKLFHELEKQKEKLLITEEVILELVYYLEYVYGWEREVITDIVDTILLDTLFSVEDREAVYEANKIYKKNPKVSFLDALKMAKARKRNVEEVISFNRRFEKEGFKLIRP